MAKSNANDSGSEKNLEDIKNQFDNKWFGEDFDEAFPVQEPTPVKTRKSKKAVEEVEVLTYVEEKPKSTLGDKVGVGASVVAILAILFGIGMLTSSATPESAISSEVEVGNNVANGQLTQILENSSALAKKDGVIETYLDGSGNLMGILIYVPQVDKTYAIAYDGQTGTSEKLEASSQTMRTFAIGEKGSILPEDNVVSDGKGIYTIQFTDAANASSFCIGVATDTKVVKSMVVLDCATGKMDATQPVTNFEYGVTGQALEIYNAAIAAK